MVVTKYEYDEPASEAVHHDVVHEVPEPGTRDTWIEAMRRLNAIGDPLARDLIKLHQDCGSGVGECDSVDDIGDPNYDYWGCSTLATIAKHHRIDYPI